MRPVASAPRRHSPTTLRLGTALIAAERTGTRCYAMEIDPIYVEVALRRWERFSGQTAALIGG